jgi:hypothetical protein
MFARNLLPTAARLRVFPIAISRRLSSRSPTNRVVMKRSYWVLRSRSAALDKGEVFVKEIAAEVNRLLGARGETRQLSPEKVGHKLKKVGVFTRRLSHAGNGLTLDQPTRMRLREVAAAYLGEDLMQGDGNLHCSSREKNEVFREDMEDMEDLSL